MILEVKVRKILHTDSKTNYRIFKGQILNAEYSKEEEKYKPMIDRAMTFKGNVTYCAVNDIYQIHAKFNRDRYGKSLLIETSVLKKIELESELEAYMVKHVDGVGPKTAKLIMEKLGINAINIIQSDEGVDALVEILGKSKINQAENIRAHILYNANIFSIMEFLQLHNQPVNIATKILEEYGNEKLLNIKTNPYLFIRCIEFEKLDAIASEYHCLDKENMFRLSAGVVALVNRNTSSRGDVYTHIEDIYENLENYINNYGRFEAVTLTKERIREVMDYALENKLLSCENNEYLYIPYLRNKENDVAYHIRRLNKQCRKVSSKDVLKLIADYENEKNIKASDEQKEAVIKAMQNDFTVLTGLPGAGKTFTINLIIQIYLKLNPNATIKTIAPTGKASRRMTEVTGIEAETIHRALKINEFTKQTETLNHDLIIIDEASMLDIYIAGTLFGSIADGSRVLMVGDIEQLPSIGAGLILRDIIDSGVVPVTRLTKLFRQAEDSYIVKNAHAIANETYDFIWDGKKGAVIWKDNTVEGIRNKVMASYKKLILTGHAIDSIGLLSPFNSGDLGTASINKEIQEKFNLNGKSISINDSGDILKEGDLVMQTENNYNIEIYNGEVGRVISVGNKKDDEGNFILTPDGKKDISVVVDYNGREVVYDKKLCKQLSLAYCISIHKSQGSEYKAVITIIHDSHEMMLNKNLIYTAMTRAKEKLVIIGDEDTFIKTVKKKDAISRLSNLKQKLNKEEFKKTITTKSYDKITDTSKAINMLELFGETFELDYKVIGYTEDGDEIF